MLARYINRKLLTRDLFLFRWALYGLAWSYLNKTEFLQDPPRGGFAGWFAGGLDVFFEELNSIVSSRYFDAELFFGSINIWPLVFIGLVVLWRYELDYPVDFKIGRGQPWIWSFKTPRPDRRPKDVDRGK